MKKVLLAAVIVGVALYFFMQSQSSTVSYEPAEKNSRATLPADSAQVPAISSDFETYTSQHFGFVMNVPREITTYEGFGVDQKEKADTMIVREFVDVGRVYLVAKSNEGIIGPSGEVLSAQSEDSTVFMSTIFVRPLVRWEDIGQEFELLIRSLAPDKTQLSDLEFKMLEEHPSVNIYSAVFTTKNEKGEAVEAEIPINFKAVFSPEYKKVAIWIVGQDYIFGKSLPDGTYKVFDDDIIESLKFIR